MNKQDFLKKYVRNDEDYIPLAQILDKCAVMNRTGAVTSTVFLNERQRVLAEQMLQEVDSAVHTCFGGYPDAERRIILFLPDWAKENPSVYAPLSYIRASWSEKSGVKIGHRDFLGALMGAGIRRETVGDILPNQTSCDFIVLQSIAPYLMQNFFSAGRVTLSLAEITAEELFVPEKDVRTIQDTVASLRLDSIVGAGFGLSREKAATLIRSGRVIVGGLVCEKPDRQLMGGETVSARGFGKFRLSEDSHTTKKGRIGITIEKYI